MGNGFHIYNPYSKGKQTGAYELFANPTLGDALSATAGMTAETNPTQSLVNLLRRESTSDVIGMDQANERFSIGNLKFDRDISESRAKYLNEKKQEEMFRAEILARGPKGIGAGVAKFGVGLAVSAVDPLNIASGFIPSMAVARVAALGKVAVAGAATQRVSQTVLQRAGTAALDGVAGAALIEPIVYSAAQRDQADYGAADVLANLAFGGIIGGTIGGVARSFEIKAERKFSALRAELDKVDVQDRREMFRTAFAEVSQNQLPRNADAMLQRHVVERANRFGLQELTYRADGSLSGDNARRLESRSNGEKVAAIPVARFESRAKADKFIRETQDRSSYLTQMDERTGEYVVSNIRSSSVLKNEMGQIMQFKSYDEAMVAAKQLGDFQPVALVREAGRAEQSFIAVEGITEAEAKAMSKDASFLEFYEPPSGNERIDAANPAVRQQFLDENDIKLKEIKFDPEDVDNDIDLYEPESTDMKVEYPDIPPADAKYNAETDLLIKDMTDQDGLLSPEQTKRLSDADEDVAMAQNESQTIRSLAFCILGKR